MYSSQVVRYTLACGLHVIFASAAGLAGATFKNDMITRTVDLGGSLTHVTTTYAIRAMEKDAQVFSVSLSEEEEGSTTWFEAKLKGNSAVLDVDRHGFNPKNHAFLYSIMLPKALNYNQTANLVVSTVQSHASTPLPATAAQGEPQSLLYKTPLYVLSPYTCDVQRTKIRSPTTMFRSYTDVKDIPSKYVEKGKTAVTKSGATLTYGPFNNIPESMNTKFQESHQKTLSIHYDYDQPVLTVASLERSAEISHWGANLNVHDELVLRNDGPTLKGQFSRLEHQSQMYFKRKASHVMRELVLHLPAGARDPYFIDLVGNVSTSHFRPSAPSSALLTPAKSQSSILELRPRYPLLGGWNYTFTLGYDTPLEEAAKYDASTGQYIVAIPYLTNIPGAAFDKTQLKIVLPEGATDISVHPSFAPDVIERSRHVTYLDTTGRTAILLKKDNVSDKHAGIVYVTYSLSTAAHFKKPLVVTSAALALFTFVLGVRRFDLTLRK